MQPHLIRLCKVENFYPAKTVLEITPGSGASAAQSAVATSHPEGADTIRWCVSQSDHTPAPIDGDSDLCSSYAQAILASPGLVAWSRDRLGATRRDATAT